MNPDSYRTQLYRHRAVGNRIVTLCLVCGLHYEFLVIFLLIAT